MLQYSNLMTGGDFKGCVTLRLGTDEYSEFQEQDRAHSHFLREGEMFTADKTQTANRVTGNQSAV